MEDPILFHLGRFSYSSDLIHHCSYPHPMTQLYQFLLGLLLAVLISLISLRVHALSRSGALAATILGTVVFGLGGLYWAVVLVGFFISSSGLSRLLKSRKASMQEKFSKGSRRDAGQVIANGGIAGLCVLLHLAIPGSWLPWAAFAGSLAAANADTWATELGVLSRRNPILITRWVSVERGTSGGISLAGTVAAFSGGLFIAALSLLYPTSPGTLDLATVLARLGFITFAGLGGSFFDSLLGATVQAIYQCPVCRKETERHPNHSCGNPTVKLRGWSWMNNDVVNILCTLSGAVISALLLILIV
jgi:uncharacterized protein (TIGR00297 family)